MKSFELTAIGRVESGLTNLADAPKQADEGAPPAWLVFDPSVVDGLASIRVGDTLVLVTWLDRARRDVLQVHPRGDTSRPVAGVFSTRSPNRPNPVGLHRVRVSAVEGARIRVHELEAIDGTPIVDLKAELSEDPGQR